MVNRHIPCRIKAMETFHDSLSSESVVQLGHTQYRTKRRVLYLMFAASLGPSNWETRLPCSLGFISPGTYPPQPCFCLVSSQGFLAVSGVGTASKQSLCSWCWAVCHSFFFLINLFGCTAHLVGSQFPDQGLNLGHGNENPRILTTRPPENSPASHP